MATTSNPDLPKVGQTVELWFSGYDEYYAGRVESLEPPDYFTVVLDDGSSWPVDRVNNIWKFPDNPAQSTSDNNADTDPNPESKDEPKLGDDADIDAEDEDHAAALQHNDDTAATRGATTASTGNVDVDPGEPTIRGKTLEADPLVKSPSDQVGNAKPKMALSSTAQRRRGTGRALRKSTGPSSKPTSSAGTAGAREPSGDEGSSSQTRVAGKRRGRPLGRGRGSGENGNEGVEGEVVGTRRSLRKRGGGVDDEGGIGVLTTRVTRRTRQSSGDDGGLKRGVEEMEVEEEFAVEDDLGAKRRRGVMEKVVEKSVIVANGTEGGADKLMIEGNNREEGEERLSTQAVTAIAVDAALASAKAVLKPLSDKMKKLSEEMVGIHKEVKEAYEAMMKSSVKPKVVGKPLGAEVSQAALDALLLDLSETIGGGEARIHAYEQMSDVEFDLFRKALQENAKALNELDRLLGDARVEKVKESGRGVGRRGRKA